MKKSLLLIRGSVMLLVFSAAAGAARASDVRTLLRCESEAAGSRGSMLLTVTDRLAGVSYQGTMTVSAQSVIDGVVTPLVVQDNIRAERVNNSVGSTDESLVLLPADHTRGLRLFLFQGETCADGTLRAEGGFRFRGGLTQGLGNGAFCCTEN